MFRSVLYARKHLMPASLRRWRRCAPWLSRSSAGLLLTGLWRWCLWLNGGLPREPHRLRLPPGSNGPHGQGATRQLRETLLCVVLSERRAHLIDLLLDAYRPQHTRPSSRVSPHISRARPGPSSVLGSSSCIGPGLSASSTHPKQGSLWIADRRRHAFANRYARTRSRPLAAAAAPRPA